MLFTNVMERETDFVFVRLPRWRSLTMEKTATRMRRGRARMERTTNDVEKGGISKLLLLLVTSMTWPSAAPVAAPEVNFTLLSALNRIPDREFVEVNRWTKPATISIIHHHENFSCV